MRELLAVFALAAALAAPLAAPIAVDAAPDKFGYLCTDPAGYWTGFSSRREANLWEASHPGTTCVKYYYP